MSLRSGSLLPGALLVGGLLSGVGVPVARGAGAFDPTHTSFQRVLDARLSGGRVDYAAIHAAPADLAGYVAEVAAAPVSTLSAADRKALSINAYNACTMKLVADSYPIVSMQDLDGGKVWDTRRCVVGGVALTLDEIEGGLRKLGDPRIHAALNCAAIGCPPLSSQVYTGATLDAQLDAAATRWAATAGWGGGVLSVNRIFDWYGEDFIARHGAASFDIPGLDGKTEAAANFIAAYAPERAGALRAGGYTVTFVDYDWRLNGK